MRMSLIIFLFLVGCGTAPIKPQGELHCPAPIKINETKFPWNDHDEKTLQSTYAGCRRHYLFQVCPIKFYKIGEQDYYVECGVKRRR